MWVQIVFRLFFNLLNTLIDLYVRNDSERRVNFEISSGGDTSRLGGTRLWERSSVYAADEERIECGHRRIGQYSNEARPDGRTMGRQQVCRPGRIRPMPCDGPGPQGRYDPETTRHLLSL